MNRLQALVLSVFTLAIVSCGPKELTYDGSTEEVSVADLTAAMSNTLETAETFEFNGRANYISGTSDVNFAYSIRLKKDSVIWVDIKDPFVGLKVARAIIYPDSAAFYNRLESTWMAGGIELVREKLQLGLEFHHLQSVLLGEPLYLPKTNKDVTLHRGEGRITATVMGMENDPLFAFDTAMYVYTYGYVSQLPLLHQQLPDGPRVLEVDYAYQDEDRGIPYKTTLELKWESEVSLKLTHNQVLRDVDLHIPFSIPSGYERIQ